MHKQHGISLTGLTITLVVLGFLGVMAAKLLPAYLEYWGVKKIFATMVNAGETRGTVREIRRAYDLRNAVEDVKSVRSEDLDITKEGGEAVVTANWSVKIPLVYNVSACIDFMATTAK